MRTHLTNDRSLPALVSSLLVAVAVLGGPPRAQGQTVRTLDAGGRQLSVGNWITVLDSSGTPVRIASTNVLGWEWWDGEQLLLHGLVPSTDGGQLNTRPSLSRNPTNDEIWLAWSQQSPTGRFDLALRRFADGAWLPDAPEPLAPASFSRLAPSIVHSATGSAHVAYRKADGATSIQMATWSADHRLIDLQHLSSGLSVNNGPPRLGIGPDGRVIAAFFGSRPDEAEVRIFVLAAGPTGGGFLPLPQDPVVELGLKTSTIVPTGSSMGGSFPDLRITVLGGTAVAWWLDVDQAGRTTFRHVHEDQVMGWLDAPVRSLVLAPTSSGPEAALAQALATVEAFVRRTTPCVTPPPGRPAPSLPVPGPGVLMPLMRRQ